MRGLQVVGLSSELQLHRAGSPHMWAISIEIIARCSYTAWEGQQLRQIPGCKQRFRQTWQSRRGRGPGSAKGKEGLETLSIQNLQEVQEIALKMFPLELFIRTPLMKSEAKEWWGPGQQGRQ